MTDNWIILGATSSMARAFARAVAKDGARVFLAGRDMADLNSSALDCAARGAPVSEAMPFDARKQTGFSEIIERVSTEDGMINVAVFVGSMPPQDDIDSNPSLINGTVMDSFTGPAALLQEMAPIMEELRVL